MPRIHKTLHMIQQIREIRRGRRVGEGAKSTIFETEHGEFQKVADLRQYLDDPDDAKYYKLKRIKGTKTLHCLPFKEPKAYKILYTTGRAFSIANNTVCRRSIEEHLSTLFDCRIRIMCRNINWKADDLTSNPGVFELMAFLDGAPLGGKFDDLNPSELDGKLYSIVDNNLKEHVLPRLQNLEDTVEELQTHVETLDERVDEIETDLSIREYVDGKMAEMEARLEDKVTQQVLRMLEEFDRQKLEAAGTNCKVATITRVSVPPREDFP